MKIATTVRNAGTYADLHLAAWMAENSVLLTRITLGIIFLWFGVLKFFHGQSDAELLAAQTIYKLSGGHIPASISLPVLATWECVIGLGLLTGLFLRGTIALLFLQMAGTFLPLIFFPDQTWKHAPYVPSLLGQYIIKNLVLICAGLLVGGTVRGGRMIADPEVGTSSHRLGLTFERLRRRFGMATKPVDGPMVGRILKPMTFRSLPEAEIVP